jgi:hypothetical protein
LLILLEIIGGKCMNKSLLYTTVYFKGSFTIYRTRKTSYNLLNSKIFIQDTEIKTPKDLDLAEYGVYDLAFSRYISSSNIFELSIYYIGTYISYTLDLQEPILTNISMGTGLEVKIYVSFNIDEFYIYEVLLDDWVD